MSYFSRWVLSGFSDTRHLVAQLIGFVPLILSLFVFLQKDRKRMLFLKTCSDALFAAHYFILGEWSGGSIILVNAIRSIVFLQKNKSWASKKLIPILFCGFTVLSTLPGFDGIKSLLAVVGSCFAIIGFWQTDVKRLRFFNLVGVVLWLIYGFWTISIPTVISNSLSILSIILAFMRERHKAE